MPGGFKSGKVNRFEHLQPRDEPAADQKTFEAKRVHQLLRKTDCHKNLTLFERAVLGSGFLILKKSLPAQTLKPITPAGLAVKKGTEFVEILGAPPPPAPGAVSSEAKSSAACSASCAASKTLCQEGSTDCQPVATAAHARLGMLTCSARYACNEEEGKPDTWTAKMSLLATSVCFFSRSPATTQVGLQALQL